MLELTIAVSEMWDEEHEVFVHETVTVQLEHSLVSLSKWESSFEKPFLGSDKTPEETRAYIEYMVISPNFDPKVLNSFNENDIAAIQKYISAKMSATWFKEDKKSRTNSEAITSELIYYWMVAMEIPFECQNWHLNRLLTLIRICNIKNTPQKKRTPQEIARERRELNERRRTQLGTRG